MRGLGDFREVGQAAEDIGILHHDAAGVPVDPRNQPVIVGPGGQAGRRTGDLVVGELGHRPHHFGIMRVQRAREHDLALLPAGDPARHGHRFPARGRAVVHRRIGDRAAIEPRDLRLEFEQHLERALRDFGLVGRIGGQELAALDDVIDAGRDMVLVRSCPEKERRVGCGKVLLAQPPHMLFDRHFAGVHRQAFNRAGKPRCLGYIGEQRIDIRRADRIEHVRTVGIGQG